MSEQALVTIIVALIGSQILPTLLGKIKPKTELDAFNIAKTMELYEKLEEKHTKLEQKYDTLQKKYETLKDDFDDLERENERLKGEI